LAYYHTAHLAYALVVPFAQARDRHGRKAPRFAPMQSVPGVKRFSRKESEGSNSVHSPVRD